MRIQTFSPNVLCRVNNQTRPAAILSAHHFNNGSITTVQTTRSVSRGGFKAESLVGHITRKASSPLPSPPPLWSALLPSPLPPALTSPPSPPLLSPPSCLPCLRSRLRQIQLGGQGSAVSSPIGSGAEPQPKLNLVNFSLKIWHLVATISMIFLRINWTTFMQFEH